MRRMSARWLLVPWLAMGLSISAESSTTPDTVRMGYSIRTLLDVNTDDARAATAVLATQLARRKGLNIEVESYFYTSHAEIIRHLNSGFLHFVSLVGDEHLALSPHVQLEASLVPMRRGSVYEEILFLIPAGSDTTRQLASFAEARLLVNLSGNAELASIWLAGMAWEESLPSTTFNFEVVSRISDAVIPVVLGEAAGCLVFSNSLATMIELNPQLGRDLIVWRESPRILMSVLSFNKATHVPAEDSLRQGILELRDEPEGRQLLDMFRVEGHVPFDEEYIVELRQMMRRAEGAPNP